MPSDDGDPLLLIHGLGLSRRSWKPVLRILTCEHEILAPDLPGSGPPRRFAIARPPSPR